MSKPNSKPKTKQQAAQVASARKAARVKAEAEAKQPQKPWLVRTTMNAPAPTELLPETSAQTAQPHQPQAPPVRLLSKAEVLDITNTSFPTLWEWMRQKKFPRSRVVGGRSMWLSSEIDEWVKELPVRRLKGDTAAVA